MLSKTDPSYDIVMSHILNDTGSLIRNLRTANLSPTDLANDFMFHSVPVINRSSVILANVRSRGHNLT